MRPQPSRVDRSQGAIAARIGAVVVAVLSLGGLIAGLFLVQSLGGDLRSSLTVTHSALEAISRTVETVDEIAESTAASIEAAAEGARGASQTADDAVVALESIASLLEEEIPETVESVTRSMPAAIQAANAIDGTLRALSLFGVDYDPNAPFGESLAEVNTALVSLPQELRAQSASIRALVSSAESLADDTEGIARSVEGLGTSLDGFTSLTTEYEATIAEAEITIEESGRSIESSIWLLRAVVIGAAVAGLGIAAVLFVLGREIESLHYRLADLSDAEHLETASH
jgi:hypothetical protein